MFLTILVPPAILAVIILAAVSGNAARKRRETRICTDIRRVLEKMKPLAAPGTFDADVPAAARTGSPI